MDIQFGIETEIGITREGAEDADVVAESIALVRSAQAPGVRMCWDYQFEDPHQDARGFRVRELRQDTDEAHYFAQDAARELTFSEIKSDLALKNGARFYNDHAHPEYCTPECATLLEMLQQDHSGDHLLMACAREVTARGHGRVLLYKNNTDFRGHSYGCHENYLMPRALPWEHLAAGVTGFLVTRQIFCGAGKYAWEAEDTFVRPGFQISQRADFFSVLQSVDTMQRRPIVNTRDEPHANPRKHRRFHVILGDANLSPYANWLKIGTTALVLQALANGAAKDKRIPRPTDPLGALQAISRDLGFRWPCPIEGDRLATALTVQETYLTLVREYVPAARENPEWRRLMSAWEEILFDLANDPLSTSDRLDWSAKRFLIEQFREAEGVGADDPWLQSLDLAYHLLDPDEGLFYGLRAAGHFRLPWPESELSAAAENLSPPVGTRAAIRGLCIEKFGSSVEAAQWDLVRLRLPDGQLLEISLNDLFDPAQIASTRQIIQAAATVADLAALPLAKVLRPS